MRCSLPAALVLLAAPSGNTFDIRNRNRQRPRLPQEIFRDDVEPENGGKVPEAALLRYTESLVSLTRLI